MGYSRDALVHRLFEEQARRTPEAVAIVVPSTERGVGPRLVSYRDLDGQANWLSMRLTRAGVTSGQRVAVLLERSPEMIVSFLATLKSRAAYVPLDPSYPRARLDFMMADIEARVLVSKRALQGRLSPPGCPVLTLDDEIGSSIDSPAVDEAGSGADAPAYVIYTSGSTGQPKGVIVPHRGIVRLLLGSSYARLDATRTVLQLAPASFDAATFEIWGPLLHGGRCVLFPGSGVPDLGLLGKVVRENRVTTMWLTASLFNLVIDQDPGALAGVEEVLTGGEALSVSHVRRAQFLLPGVQLINGYGPTESTTFACCYRIPPALPAGLESIPIGPPIANTTIRLMDPDLRASLPGEAGDLYIGGDGLAIGYLNRADLTAERFIVARDGERLYKTGDRARLLADGSFEFLGRIDDQVKIRGHRVELGEIESALRKHPAVGDAVVTLREDAPGDKRLAAYYTGLPAAVEPTATVLRQFLAARLPEYMVPSHFVPLRDLPLTPNGKADRRSLPAPGRQRPALERPMLAPRNAVEAWVAGHWCELLALEEIGVHDRFFELGGTSVTAMRLLARLSQDTRTSLPTLLLFRAPTIAEMASILGTEYGDLLPPSLVRSAAAAASSGAQPWAQAAMSREQSALHERRMRRRLADR